MGVADELKKFHDLRQAGVLTEAEYEAEKAKLLSPAGTAAPPPPPQAQPQPQVAAPAGGSELAMLIPTNRPLSAIASGYLGLFSIFPFFGILAVATGIYALNVLKQNPTMWGHGRAYFGIVCGGAGTLLT